MTRWNHLTLFLLSVLVSQLQGSCFFDLLKSGSTTNAAGKETTEHYCEYSGTKYTINSTWTLPYPDCFNCGCYENGLECCGYGPSAGVMQLPDDCELAKNTCKVILVRKDDPSQLCDETDRSKPAQIPKRIRYHLRRKNLTINVQNTKSGAAPN